MIALGGVHEEMGRQVLAAIASMRESGRQRMEAHQQGPTSEVGSTEVPQAPASAGLGVSSGSGLTTRQVAEVLRVSPRQVRYLIEGEKLSATWVGRQKVVDEASVVLELERRQRGAQR